MYKIHTYIYIPPNVCIYNISQYCIFAVEPQISEKDHEPFTLLNQQGQENCETEEDMEGQQQAAPSSGVDEHQESTPNSNTSSEKPAAPPQLYPMLPPPPPPPHVFPWQAIFGPGPWARRGRHGHHHGPMRRHKHFGNQGHHWPPYQHHWHGHFPGTNPGWLGFEFGPRMGQMFRHGWPLDPRDGSHSDWQNGWFGGEDQSQTTGDGSVYHGVKHILVRIFAPDSIQRIYVYKYAYNKKMG